MGRSFNLWFFELGNFVAFIPFGVVIPLLFRSNFIRFITIFILSITILEILQMLSRLGSFDIDDIIINTFGAAVGFWAQRVVHLDRDHYESTPSRTLDSISGILWNELFMDIFHEEFFRFCGDTVMRIAHAVTAEN
jgi:glycopeptide antibiotics resistance protein